MPAAVHQALAPVTAIAFQTGGVTMPMPVLAAKLGVDR